ncbi:hypothetical protein TraAM80_02823 [Trypanosoma rangeli]|uniref:PH-like domain-containing protein n=1 Tax=Trypanosoma rangeli TaxID=5698 RepID=A0A422NRZ7_TRYRA|nr:uncharacterized protein TraAM80_02823 [Trypanosoma rangeli]RNF08250.1 hypothetical protein TraAM80_02823 [Trypanosoma rangeli]|eukprot:RNF08250.1 hypothetical protein TraAM80_02823 [Trypanosoma rangeli]
MSRSVSVDYLSHRLREMSRQRDRLLNEGNQTAFNTYECYYPCNVAEGMEYSSFERHHQGPHRSWHRGGCLNLPTSLPERKRRGYRGDVVTDDDRLPSSCRRPSLDVRKYPAHKSDYGGKNRKLSCRWVTLSSDEDQSRESTFYTQAHSGSSAPFFCTPSKSFSQVPPSSLLIALVNNVARRRGVYAPAIPQEVVIAFENCVKSGTLMLKFVLYDAPHERFFMIKFLDFKVYEAKVGPVLCWYTSARSSTIRRYLPLTNLTAVIDGGDGHPAVQKRMMGPGVIKGAAFNLKTTYLGTDYILQWHFSLPRGEEERLAVKFLCKTSYIAWRVVTEFFSKIGSAMMPTMQNGAK